MSFIDFNSYEKDTCLINSDRLILNSKDDSVFILSKKTTGISAEESVHMNIGPKGSSDKKYFLIINSPLVQLGLPSQGTNEPVAKADSAINLMKEVFTALDNFSSTINGSVALGVGTATLPQITSAASMLRMELNRIKTKYLGTDSPIKSKITKTI